MQFFRSLLAAAQQLSECEFVISLSENFRKKLGEIPANVHVFESVPQPNNLKRSSLFIIHGGLNSIWESIALGVPMLVFPVDKRWDQPSNAAKVMYHGLGLKSSMTEENSESLNFENQYFNQSKLVNVVFLNDEQFWNGLNEVRKQ